MTSRTKNIIIILIVAAAFAALIVSFSITGKMKMNQSDAVGNTAGNLNNNGLFCESGNKVYFSNLYDGGAMYSMNTDQSDMKMINESDCYSINCAGDYLYYCMQSDSKGSGLGSLVSVSGVYRSKTNGKGIACLDNKHILTLSLSGNYVFYQRYTSSDFTTLYKQNIDKSGKTEIADYVVNPSCIANGRMYFNGTVNDHHLYEMNVADNSVKQIWDQDIWDPVYQDGWIYYMDIHNNYCLCRYSLQDQTQQTLTKDRIDYFNILGDTIYYAKSDKLHPALIRMRSDGSSPETVKDGVYENINMTSAYTYFTEYGNKTPVYMTPTNGDINVTGFSQAASAAMKHMSKKN